MYRITISTSTVGIREKSTRFGPQKYTLPHTFRLTHPLLFIWTFNDGGGAKDNAQTVCKIVERLYQLGRGVDMAWAWAELLDAGEVETRLARHGGVVHQFDDEGGAGKALLCPSERITCKPQKAIRCGITTRFTSVKEGRSGSAPFLSIAAAPLRQGRV